MCLAAAVVEFGSCRLGLDSMLSLVWLGFELMARADLNKNENFFKYYIFSIQSLALNIVK